MWICDDCGAVFKEPGFYKEIHTELDEHPTEMISCCPECGGGFWSEADQCAMCGEYYETSKLIAGKLCNSCLLKLIGTRNDIMQKYCILDRDSFAEFAVKEIAAE